MSNDVEEWRPVVGYEGFYEVSDWGRVRSLPRILASQFNGEQYGRVRLFDDKGGKRRSIHSLVAEAFIGPRPSSLHEINHKNGKPADNRANNLEYMTKLENMRHSFYVLRTMKPPPSGERHNSKTHHETFPRGETHGNAKLTGRDVRRIRRLYAKGGISQPALAREYGVSQKVIWQIVHRVTWAHVK